MNKIYTILFLSLLILNACAVSKEYDIEKATFARNNTTFIKEMAEYAILFCRKNDTLSFSSDNIADRKSRKKIERLGSTITVTYYSPGSTYMDSCVTFKYITITHGVIEFMYDFGVHPRNLGTDTAGKKQSITIQAAERVYYNRRPFPLM